MTFQPDPNSYVADEDLADTTDTADQSGIVADAIAAALSGDDTDPADDGFDLFTDNPLAAPVATDEPVEVTETETVTVTETPSAPEPSISQRFRVCLQNPNFASVVPLIKSDKWRAAAQAAVDGPAPRRLDKKFVVLVERLLADFVPDSSAPAVDSHASLRANLVKRIADTVNRDWFKELAELHPDDAKVIIDADPATMSPKELHQLRAAISDAWSFKDEMIERIKEQNSEQRSSREWFVNNRLNPDRDEVLRDYSDLLNQFALEAKSFSEAASVIRAGLPDAYRQVDINALRDAIGVFHVWRRDAESQQLVIEQVTVVVDSDPAPAVNEKVQELLDYRDLVVAEQLGCLRLYRSVSPGNVALILHGMLYADSSDDTIAEFEAALQAFYEFGMNSFGPAFAEIVEDETPGQPPVDIVQLDLVDAGRPARRNNTRRSGHSSGSRRRG